MVFKFSNKRANKKYSLKSLILLFIAGIIIFNLDIHITKRILRFIYMLSGIAALIYSLNLVKKSKTYFKEISLNDEIVTFEFFYIYKNKIVISKKDLTIITNNEEIQFKNISGDGIGIAKREFLMNKED